MVGFLYINLTLDLKIPYYFIRTLNNYNKSHMKKKYIFLYF
jgi:hypothetical protein